MNDNAQQHEDLSIRTGLKAGDDNGQLGTGSAAGNGQLGTGNAAGNGQFGSGN
jgi:hypothetical protein